MSMRNNLRKPSDPAITKANTKKSEIGAFRAQHLDLARRQIRDDFGSCEVVVDDAESPLVWLAKRNDSPEINDHGKESLNFQISMLIYNVVAAVLCLVLIGFIILPILHILNLVLVIVASIRASEGKFYRYPITIRLIK